MIIKDFTDNDLYKFTTMNAIQKKFPDAEVIYRFVNRGETDFPSGSLCPIYRTVVFILMMYFVLRIFSFR